MKKHVHCNAGARGRYDRLGCAPDKRRLEKHLNANHTAVKTVKYTLGAALIGLASIILSNAAFAQASAFPSKSVRIVVAFPVGSSPDLVARAVGDELAKIWNHPVVVDNRAGAGAIIGTDAVAKAAPDGHTIYLATLGALALNPHLYKKLPYDPVQDFQGITYVAENPFALAVHPSVQANTIAEFVALSKASGKLNYGSGASFAQLTGEAFKNRTGAVITHVPYKGVQQAVTDFLGGQVQIIFADLPSILPFHKSGKARILGLTGARRSGIAPEIAAIAESGYPGYDYSTWYAFVAPSATQRPVIEKLNADTVGVLNRADIRKRLEALGLDVRPSKPDDVNQLVKAEIQKWGQVVKAAGIEPQ